MSGQIGIADCAGFRCGCVDVRLSECVDECRFASFREDNSSADGVTSRPVQLYQSVQERQSKHSRHIGEVF